MKRSNRLVILVGVLLAVLAFVAIVILLNQDPNAGEPTEPETATVLVASEPITIGTVVTPAMTETREIPVDAAQVGVLQDTSQLGGRTAMFDLPEGSQVTEALFGGQGGGTVDIAGQLLAGEKAIAIQVDRVTGLNFLLQQGDVVDVILALDFVPGSVPGGTHWRSNDTEILRSVKAVLQAKRVLYISDTNIPPPPVLDDEGNEVPVDDPTVEGSIIVILAGNDQDAELLTFAQRSMNEVGTLTLTLRDSQDTAAETTTGVTLFDIFETYGLVIPEAVTELIPEGDEGTE